MDTLLGYLVKIAVDNGLGNVVYSAVCNAVIIGDGLCAVKHGNAFDILEHNLSCIKCELAAVGTVNLVAVVLGRVMGSCDHDTCAALQVSYCVGKHGSGHKLGIDMYLDAVCSQN